MHLEMHASLKRRWVIHQKDSAYKEVCTQYKTASITGCLYCFRRITIRVYQSIIYFSCSMLVTNPSSILIIRSQPSAYSRSCVTMTTVCPTVLFRSAIKSTTWVPETVSRLAVGSSAKRIFGFPLLLVLQRHAVAHLQKVQLVSFYIFLPDLRRQ